jgi:antitoxin (DNA-binding transcriptional repressor) of toxin-antitoxin stability system
MVEHVPKQVGIRELKAHLSAYVKWAEAGHDITITDHGRPLRTIDRVASPMTIEQLIADDRGAE